MSLSRPYSMTSQRHLTVTAIREALGWGGQNERGYWQDLRDSAQEFRMRYFSQAKWGDMDDVEKRELCARFTQGSRHRALIEREETAQGSPYISWWLLANTRPQISTINTSPIQQQPNAMPTHRQYYDPVRG